MKKMCVAQKMECEVAHHGQDQEAGLVNEWKWTVGSSWLVWALEDKATPKINTSSPVVLEDSIVVEEKGIHFPETPHPGSTKKRHFLNKKTSNLFACMDIPNSPRVKFI